MTRKKSIILSALTGLAALLFAAFYCGLTVRNYTVSSDKLSSPIRIVLLTDLHSHIFGRDQQKLIRLIKEQNPDLIMLVGDIADDRTPIDGTVMLLEGLKGTADMYYVTGNHEYWSSSYEGIMETMRSFVSDKPKQPQDDIEIALDAIGDSGVTILSDEYVTLSLKGNTIILAGIEDPARTNYYDIRYDQESSLANAFGSLSRPDGLKILLAHRPERIELYKRYDFDIVLSGHAHGGQVRIPFILNGLYAPNQGFFPKYAGGLYEHDGLTHIVSRGLVVKLLPPRIFNPPEVVVIDILPTLSNP